MEKLYKNYGKTSDEEIQSLLNSIKIVVLTHMGVGTVYGYYPINDKLLLEIKDDPRGTAYTFKEESQGSNLPLEKFKTIKFLVKSSSRFFFKPDIGEVFDQMTEEDKKKVKAICCVPNSQMVIAGTAGEHFICEAILLK